MSGWWENAVIYQIYPRSFQDSDGDGIGDIPGVIERLGHVAALGADAVWLSPIYPSPGADFGYDVSDHRGVDPLLGTLADVERLIGEVHERGMRLLLDLIPSHTSIEHPWFEKHPDWYVWSDEGPPNNWVAAFGGPAWSPDPESGRWYLHSFFPEQPDLDWSNPEVRKAFGDVIAFWIDRGIDGFRVDAADRLAKDPVLRDDPPASEPFPFPIGAGAELLEPVHSRGADGIGRALAAIREAAGGAYLVGEVYLPTARLPQYLRWFDSAFCFDLLHSSWEPAALRRALENAAGIDGVAWVLANHDFSRIAGRWGAENARAAAMMLLTLPGPAFVYQGDEIGMSDGPGAEPALDRFGRDSHRHPMQWDGSPAGGFTAGDPWLPPIDPERRNVAEQLQDPDSILSLYRALIELRRELCGDLELRESASEILEYSRGEHLISINIGEEPTGAGEGGEQVIATEPEALVDGMLSPHAGVVRRLDR